jgi:hypothetical protein
MDLAFAELAGVAFFGPVGGGLLVWENALLGPPVPLGAGELPPKLIRKKLFFCFEGRATVDVEATSVAGGDGRGGGT